jgi:hypothetical protein
MLTTVLHHNLIPTIGDVELAKKLATIGEVLDGTVATAATPKNSFASLLALSRNKQRTCQSALTGRKNS